MLCGAGSREQSPALFRRGLPGFARVAHTVKYLGHLCSLAGTNVSDRTRRVQGMRAGFAALKGFWHRAPRRFARVAFRAMCHSPLVAGWNAVAPTATDVKVMEVPLMGLARALLRGEGCKKETRADEGHEGEVSYKALPNREVWSRLGWRTCLRSWRLTDYIFEHCDRHDSLLATLFGTYSWSSGPFDADGALVPSALPWVRNLDTDVRLLFDLDGGGALGGPLLFPAQLVVGFGDSGGFLLC